MQICDIRVAVSSGMCKGEKNIGRLTGARVEVLRDTTFWLKHVLDNGAPSPKIVGNLAILVSRYKYFLRFGHGFGHRDAPSALLNTSSWAGA